jgi:transposase
MIPVPSGVRVWLAVGYTDMRRGMNSLAVQVPEVLKRDPHAGDLYVFHCRSPAAGASDKSGPDEYPCVERSR